MSRRLMILLVAALTLLCFAGVALAENQDSHPTSVTNIKEIKPIPPDEIVKWAEKKSETLISTTQGVIQPVVPYTIIIIGVLFVLGAFLAALRITSKILATAIAVSFALIVMYVMVFHPQNVIALFKGFFGG